MLVHWIWLATRNHVSDRLKVELVHHFQDPETIYFADAESYNVISGINAEGKAALADKNLQEAENILRLCRRKNLQILTFQDLALVSGSGLLVWCLYVLSTCIGDLPCITLLIGHTNTSHPSSFSP